MKSLGLLLCVCGLGLVLGCERADPKLSGASPDLTASPSGKGTEAGPQRTDSKPLISKPLGELAAETPEEGQGWKPPRELRADEAELFALYSKHYQETVGAASAAALLDELEAEQSRAQARQELKDQVRERR